MGCSFLLLADAASGYFSDTWRDRISIISLVVSVVGLVYAGWQARNAASAAEAAKEATIAMRQESLRRFTSHTAYKARQYASQVVNFLEGEEWPFAAQRLRDLAEEIGFLVGEESTWQDIQIALQTIAARCSILASGGRGRTNRTKWLSTLNEVLRKLHDHQQPV